MGIPGLFAWVRKTCPHTIKNFSYHSQSRPSTHSSTHSIERFDNLCLDMNGIFHEACQKVYKYGSYASPQTSSQTGESQEILSENVMRKKVYHEIGNIVSNLVYKVNPTKRILIMVDGPAGNAKQSQQRQRRYRSVNDTTRKFDSNCISPGTEWMDFLSKYMDQYILREVSNKWKHLEVIFSNEKVAGEGEHKVIKFIRKHGSPNESYVLYGLDADLIMLALSTQNILCQGSFSLNPPKFIILREDQKFHHLIQIDISLFRQFLIEELTWGLDCSRNNLINDYVFLCFLLGNDFLPHSPTVDLIEGGIELLFESYSGACEKHNAHLMNQDGTFNKDVLKDILFTISMSERIILEDSLKRGDKFADALLEKYIEYDDNGDENKKLDEIDEVYEDDLEVRDVSDVSDVKNDVNEVRDVRNVNEVRDVRDVKPVSNIIKSSFIEEGEAFLEANDPYYCFSEEVETISSEKLIYSQPKKFRRIDFDGYRQEYYKTKFPNISSKQVCHEYFRGMEWVYKYYTVGIPSWSWSYPFCYAPFATEMVLALDSYESRSFTLGRPMEPFHQLLSILPPQSKHLLPSSFHSLMNSFPSQIKLDFSGKKFEWQAVVVIPKCFDFEKEYQEILSSVQMNEKRRNFLGKEYIYKYNPRLQLNHQTYYGKFEHSTEVRIFQ